MKKTISVFLCVMLCLSLMPVSFAASWNRYEVPDLGMTIDLPESFYVWNQYSKPDDPVFTEYGLIYENAMNALYTTDSIFGAVLSDGSIIITIMGLDSPVVSDLRTLKKEVLDIRISSRKDQIEAGDYGEVVTNYDFFAHSQADFVKYYCEWKNDDGTTGYGVEYYTTCENKEVSISIASNIGELTESQDRLLDDIVSTISFQAMTPETGLVGTTYRDEETGVQFVLPKGFTETELTEDQKKNLSAVFISRNGEILTYIAGDVYGLLPEKERYTKTRGQMGFNDLSQSDVDDYFGAAGVPKDQVVRVRKGNNEFYETHIRTSDNADWFNARVDLTMMNGYLLTFMYTVMQDPDDSAIDKMLSSVKLIGSFDPLGDTVLGDTVLGDTDEYRRKIEDFHNRIQSVREKTQDDGAWLREYLLDLYNAGAEGKNPAGDYFYYLYNDNDGNDALLVIVSADREHYNGWEGMTVADGDHVLLIGAGSDVPFCFGDVDDNGIFSMTFLNDGDVATMHFMDFAVVVDDIVTARMEFSE